MNNELPESSQHPKTLDARFADRPEMRERLHQIADMMDQAIANGATADEAEAMAIAQIQQLGAAVLTDWGRAQQASSLHKAQQEHPAAIRHIKKK